METKHSLADICANLTAKAFHHDQDEVVARALDAGIDTMYITGSCEQESKAALELAKKYPSNMYSTAGIHPHNARFFNDQSINKLRELAQDAKVVAIGECGLDYNRNFSTHEEQVSCFEGQIQLACELDLPLFLHVRDAREPFLEVLRKYPQCHESSIVHCFTGTEEDLEIYLEMGFYIGLTGWICDERRGTDLQRIAHKIPLERLMIETDAPYLLPRTIKPKPKKHRNEPAFLPYVLQMVASCMGKTEDEIAKVTTENAHKFFRTQPTK